MELKTFKEIYDQVQVEADIESEEIVSESELVSFINSAVDIVESEIHKLNTEDDYFLAKSALSLVSGTSEYSLPSDIYANKIRHIVYENGSDIFAIKRLRGKNVFLKAHWANQSSTVVREYNYILLNQTAVGDNRKIKLYPTPQETGSYGTIWYIRNSNKCPSSDANRNTTYCDIPEYYHLILSYAKWRVFAKEQNPLAGDAQAQFEGILQNMKETLSAMVEDGDTEIEPDVDFYEEHN